MMSSLSKSFCIIRSVFMSVLTEERIFTQNMNLVSMMTTLEYYLHGYLLFLTSCRVVTPDSRFFAFLQQLDERNSQRESRRNNRQANNHSLTWFALFVSFWLPILVSIEVLSLVIFLLANNWSNMSHYSDKRLFSNHCFILLSFCFHEIQTIDCQSKEHDETEFDLRRKSLFFLTAGEDRMRWMLIP
jgi:uncharacterized membrane protein